MSAHAHTTGSPRLLRGEATRKGTTDDNEDAREAISFPLQCVKQAPESLFGDVPDLDVHTAINLAMNRVEWKENIQSRRC